MAGKAVKRRVSRFDPRAKSDSLQHERMEKPTGAREQRRPLFDPAGWFRSFERAVSHFLSRRLYPSIPGLSWPYSQILQRQLTLSSATISLDSLPTAFDGVRILVVSDIHAGSFVSPAALKGAIQKLMLLEPDLILLPGDLVTARASEFDEHREAFDLLRAPLGTFATLGNHDHYTGDVAGLAERMQASGIELLTNRSIELERAGQRLSLAGVDDLVMGSPNMNAALDNTAGPVVLMSHNPDLLFDAARRNVSLMISGHTHAGQIRIPGLPVIVRQSRYRLDEGRFRVGKTEAVVSRGLGVVGVPLRLYCSPEALLLTLKRSPA
jgi:predicted MPP superfamily phosphohydrolase